MYWSLSGADWYDGVIDPNDGGNMDRSQLLELHTQICQMHADLWHEMQDMDTADGEYAWRLELMRDLAAIATSLYRRLHPIKP